MRIEFFNYGANDREAREFTKLFYEGGFITAIRKLILTKQLTNVDFDDSIQVKEMSGDYGLIIRLKVTTDAGNINTLEFRFFLSTCFSKFQFDKVDREAGIKDKDLSWPDLFKLRVLYVLFDEIKFFSKDENASKVCNKRTHLACIWTSNPSGYMGRQGVIN